MLRFKKKNKIFQIKQKKVEWLFNFRLSYSLIFFIFVLILKIMTLKILKSENILVNILELSHNITGLIVLNTTQNLNKKIDKRESISLVYLI
jgi:hypothetical protein